MSSVVSNGAFRPVTVISSASARLPLASSPGSPNLNAKISDPSPTVSYPTKRGGLGGLLSKEYQYTPCPSNDSLSR